ncbi:MAG: Rieske (2Fe-2S) protein, partial [Candidatus Eremiobacteraeota bacterium]|nr:Rieske (2Fe-2S) protein [Candidatus Eremiobacteraeota bacterium]
AGSVVFATAFALGGQTQLEGLGLGSACLGLAAALAIWYRALLPHHQVEDEQRAERSAQSERDEAVGLFHTGLGDVVGRRGWLVRLAGGALGALGLALLLPLRSLGPNPRGRTGTTNWRRGLRLVRDDGGVVKAADLEVGGAVSVFPDGAVGSNDANAMANDAVMLVRIDEASLRMPAERAAWTPRGFIAYSKVCTHAGCPVALYRAADHQLLCPCHQSTFDVRDGASVVFGPAARPLPQLPLAIDADGTLRAAGPLSGPAGPDAWDMAT